jgi:regulator of replication initiation timing
MAEQKVPPGIALLLKTFGIDAAQVEQAVKQFGAVVLDIKEQLNRLEQQNAALMLEVEKLRAELLAHSELFPAQEDHEPTPEEVQHMIASGMVNGDAPPHS